MLIHLIPKLSKKNLILASTSPRRKYIFLQQLKLQNTQVVASPFDEKTLDKQKFNQTYEYVMESARCKAMAVYQNLQDKIGAIVVGADTVVSLFDKEIGREIILEKPESEQEATRMLKKLSNNQHKVYTGVAIIYTPLQQTQEPEIVSFYEETGVTFAELNEQEIQSYIETKEPFDKAGGYGVQDMGGAFVSNISGCYFNVMGFPLHKFCKTIYEMKDELGL